MNEQDPARRIVRAFMTHTMPDADILALQTGRETEFSAVLGAIERSRRAVSQGRGALQHVVLYGVRGFGKSFLTRRVQIEAAALPAEPCPLAYILLPEEQPNLHRSPHALLDYITQKLADRRTGGDTAWRGAQFQWPDSSKDEPRWREASARLEAELDAAFAETGGKGLAVVVIENFDILLSTLFADDIAEQRLRAWLDRPRNRVMLFATATGTVDLDYEKPLFQAFQSVRLSPWTPDDCIAYFNSLRQWQEKPPLDADQEAKARAIAEFIGGAPRLAQLLAEVLDSQDAATVVETMAALADKLADYYRWRIEDLSPLAQGLLDALIRGGEPASQTELAKRVGADGQHSIARVMNDLNRADILRGTPAPDSRETLYRVTDRVFVYYYRLSQADAAARETPLTTIIDFLRGFYSREEKRALAARHLDAGRWAEGGLFSRLAQEGEPLQQNGYNKGFVWRLETLLTVAGIQPSMTATEIETVLKSEPERALRIFKPGGAATALDAAVIAIIQAQALERLGEPGRARQILLDATVKAEGDPGPLILCLTESSLFEYHHDRGIQKSAELALRMGSLDISGLPKILISIQNVALAWALGHREEFQKALQAAKLALSTAREAGDKQYEVVSLRLLAHYLSRTQCYQQAADVASSAVDLAHEIGDQGEEAVCLSAKAWPLILLGHFDEAIFASSRASELAHQLGYDTEEADALRILAWAFNEAHRYSEAFESGEAAFNLALSAHEWVVMSNAAQIAMYAATYVAQPRAIDLFEKWIEAFRSDKHGEVIDPRLSLSHMVSAAVRARAFVQFRNLLENYNAWLLYYPSSAYSLWPSSETLSRLAIEDGRAAVFEAIHGLQMCFSAFIFSGPEERRPYLSISNMIFDFAVTCRDPGILRDIASILDTDKGPGALRLAPLLLALAEVDEAPSPERVLARMDPDMALAVRRYRSLPDPAAPSASPSKKRGRKPRG